MPRIARVVVPGCPHHAIQRGNRRQTVFFYDSDKRIYISLLHKYAKKAGVNIWAYCLMDNHVPLIMEVICFHELAVCTLCRLSIPAI